MNAKKIIATATELIAAEKTRSAWSNGVKVYAAELLADLAESAPDAIAKGNRSDLLTAMLNGASNWNNYSWGGCALIYDEDIAARLCTPSELKKTRNGERRPNGREEWLDVQARALRQAAERVVKAIEQARKDA